MVCLRAVIRGIAGLNESDAIEEVERQKLLKKGPRIAMRLYLIQLALLTMSVGSCIEAQASWTIAGEATKLFDHGINQYKNDSLLFYKQLNRLLTNFDLIGIHSSKVKEWFGEPYKFSEKRMALLKNINVQIPVDEPGSSSFYYRIPRDSDKPCFHVLRFKEKDDQIVQWSIVYNNEETNPVTKNMVLKFDGFGSLLFNEADGFRYPKTVVKTNLIKKSQRDLVDEATHIDGLKRSTPESSGRIEESRDMNMFNVEPKTVDNLDSFLENESDSYSGFDARSERHQKPAPLGD